MKNRDCWFLHNFLFKSLLIGLGCFGMVFSGCDDGSYSSDSEMGTVEFHTQRMGNDNMGISPNEKIEDNDFGYVTPNAFQNPFTCPIVYQPCDRSNINTVMVKIYNEQDGQIAQESFGWGNGGGSINVPPGQYRFVFLGINTIDDPHCSTLFRNDLIVNVSSGQTSNIGSIQLKSHFFVPEFEGSLFVPPSYDGTFLKWGSVAKATAYLVRIVDNNDSTNVLFEGNVSNNTINISTLEPPLPSGDYDWWVSAIDRYGNVGSWSYMNSFRLGWYGGCP